VAEIECPDEKVLTVWRVEAFTSWGIFLLVMLVPLILLTVGAAAPAWILAFALIPVVGGASSLLVLRQRWKRWTFEITPYTLEMSHGIWVRHRRIVSRNRIQHVDFESGPIGRKLNLVHVVVHTAGARVGTIPGITNERAEQLRTELMAGPKAL